MESDGTRVQDLARPTPVVMHLRMAMSFGVWLSGLTTFPFGSVILHKNTCKFYIGETDFHTHFKYSVYWFKMVRLTRCHLRNGFEGFFKHYMLQFPVITTLTHLI